MIRHLCSALLNERMKKGYNYHRQITEWMNECNKEKGMDILSILWLNVYGRPWGSRMGKKSRDEGKEEEETRREWERRWREAGDIMNEEDVMETSVMHLCIPDTEKEMYGTIFPSNCSYNALRVLLMDGDNRFLAYHFPVYEVNEQSRNGVIVRNFSSAN